MADHKGNHHRIKNLDEKTYLVYMLPEMIQNARLQKDTIIDLQQKVESLTDSMTEITDQFSTLLEQIEKNTTTLQEISLSIFQGIASGKDEIFYVDDEKVKKEKLEKEILHPLVKGKDIRSYKINWSGTFVIYPYDAKSKVIPESKMKEKYPNTYKYLYKNRNKLDGRSYFDKSNKIWYELWNQRQYDNFQRRRIVVPEISNNNNFALPNKYF